MDRKVVWTAAPEFMDNKVEVTVKTAYNTSDIPTWVSGTIYNAGDLVVHNGKIYECLWWTQNDEPGAYQWGAWEYVADYNSTPTVSATGITLYKDGSAVANGGSVNVTENEKQETEFYVVHNGIVKRVLTICQPALLVFRYLSPDDFMDKTEEYLKNLYNKNIYKILLKTEGVDNHECKC